MPLNTPSDPLGIQGLVGDYRVAGQYRFSVTILSTNVQGANNRVLELRNPSTTNLIVPVHLRMRAVQTAVGAVQLNALDCYRVTGFTAVDTTNTVTPVSSVVSSNMPAFPGSAVVRHLTLAGNIAGMTGGTFVKDTQAFAAHAYLVQTATTAVIQALTDAIGEANTKGLSTFLLRADEGIIVENRTLNVTTYGITWVIDLGWAEVVLY